jgi:hypothetical protein
MLRRPVSNAALRLVFATLAGACSVLSGCGSASVEPLDGPDAGAGGENPRTPRPVDARRTLEGIPIDAFPTRLAAAFCEALQACCETSGFGSGPAMCEERARANYESQLGGSVALGLRYQPLAAARCLAAFSRYLRTCSYDSRAASDAACGDVFQGTLALDQSCENDLQCAKVSGANVYCAGDLGPRAHTCQKAATEGEQCLLEGCDEGLFCDFSELTCVPQQTSGECFQFEACAPGTACSPDGAITSCAPLLENGAPCTLDLQCRSGRCGDEGCLASFATPSSCGQ